ncbi:MAG: hypothetical protein JNK11_06510, partial [Alphaproteobacteria bacterium]|nr:hypothetical protein [Alphaproteobacteria bacterium]
MSAVRAADDASWAVRLAGVYSGVAYNGGRHDPMQVSFRLEEGKLVGRYRVHEPDRTV